MFSFVTYRLERPPFAWGPTAAALLFGLWVLGAVGPAAGRWADRIGWRPLALGAVGLAATAVALSLPARAPTLVPALALLTAAMFTGITAAQLGCTTSTTRDRGTASALYFSVYYLCGALGGFLPGLAWQAWRWPGVAGVSLVPLAVALLVLLVAPGRGRRR